MFSKKEIQEVWIDCVLDPSSRIKNLGLESLPGHDFCLFGKVEAGAFIKIYILIYMAMVIISFIETTQEQRNEAILKLNAEFEASMRINPNRNAILKLMVDTYPYRIISSKPKTPKVVKLGFFYWRIRYIYIMLI